jgi:transcriptional regulator with XRE-family HTH domain
MYNLPKILKELREEHGFTQLQLAEKLGYKSAVTIAKWELGVRVPEIENIIALAKFFGVSLDYIVGMDG